jgi:hypothetical protein
VRRLDEPAESKEKSTEQDARSTGRLASLRAEEPGSSGEKQAQAQTQSRTQAAI